MRYTKKALELKAQLDKLRPIKPEDESRIMQKFRLDWNFHSNSLEGNSLTYGETVDLLLNDITAQGKSFKDHGEIRVHNEAIKYAEEAVKDNISLTEHLIRGLHQLILKEPYETDAITSDGQKTKKKVELGKYKTQSNSVRTSTGEMFCFAKPEETAAKMHDLVDWFREEEQNPDVNPIILAATFHHRFILIHPFDDGNGRLVRILMNFILMKFSYPPVIIKVGDRSNYISALTRANAGEVEFFVEYIAKNLVNSLELMIKGANGESIEEPTDFDKKLILLEQKMRSIKKEGTKENILNIFDDSIVRLDSKLFEECQKFSRFYKDVHCLYWLGDDSRGRANNLKDIRNKVNESCSEMNEGYQQTLLIRITYSFGNSPSYKIRGYDFDLLVMLEVNQYVISFNPHSIVSTKPYSEQLTDEEIENIIKPISKAHLELIETQLSNQPTN